MAGSEFNLANSGHDQTSLQKYVVDTYNFRTRASENNQE